MIPNGITDPCLGWQDRCFKAERELRDAVRVLNELETALENYKEDMSAGNWEKIENARMRAREVIVK